MSNGNDRKARTMRDNAERMEELAKRKIADHAGKSWAEDQVKALRGKAADLRERADELDPHSRRYHRGPGGSFLGDHIRASAALNPDGDEWIAEMTRKMLSGGK